MNSDGERLGEEQISGVREIHRESMVLLCSVIVSEAYYIFQVTTLCRQLANYS